MEVKKERWDVEVKEEMWRGRRRCGSEEGDVEVKDEMWR